jgi:general secretion pathway protein A
MYLAHWNLNLLPFENVPNSGFFYPSPVHEEALERMTYTVFQGKGAAMITGGVGFGKTMLSRVLIKRLTGERYHVVPMTNPALGPLDFIQMVMGLFQVPCDETFTKANMWQTLEAQLRKNLDHGRGSVLLIDEAQVISEPKTLEELRMLLNLQSEEKFLVNVILLGQLELEALIGQTEPLLQRIAIRYQLRTFTITETIYYIKHRLNVAGCNRVPFREDALKAIFNYTSGIPREINNLCDRSLLAAFIENKKNITQDIVEDAWKDLQ